jgi:hypothetical protein
MTVPSYPSDDDHHELAAAHAHLATDGVAPGEGGYDLSTLAAAVYTRGWTYGIDLVSGAYRAEIRPQGVRAQQPSVVGVGWTPDVALAFALARALAHATPAMGEPRLPRRAQEATATE